MFQTPQDWLRNFLAPGPRKASAIYAAGAQRGYSPEQLKIARAGLATKQRDDAGIVFWELTK